MRRKTFDALLSTGGIVVAAVLIIAGALLTWGHTFVDNQVHTQLAAQKVFFPDKAGIVAQKNAEITKYVTPYAGQQVVNGQQAQVFANHFIKVHLSEVAGGKTYSQVSEEWLTAVAKAPNAPATQALAGQRQTLFMGETLRGLLLNAYAFWKMGQIAFVASIVAFAGAGLMLLLAALGFWHLRRTDPGAEVFGRHIGSRTPVEV